MKLPFHGAAVAGLVALAGLVTAANAAPTVTIYENGVLTAATCLSVGASTTCATSDSNFTINSQTGATSLPAELTVTGSVNPTALGKTLTVAVYDSGFTAPLGNVALVHTANTNTNPTVEAPGTFSATGFLSDGAVPCAGLFPTSIGTCTTETPTASFASYSVNNPGITSSVGTMTTNPFGLEEILSYTFTGTGAANVTTTLAVVVPEPASVALLGGVLLLTSGLLRRRAMKRS